MESRKLQDEETGFHCLSSWLVSWSNIRGPKPEHKWQKSTTDSFVHSVVCWIQGQTLAVNRRQEPSMDVCEEMKFLLFCTQPNNMHGNTRDFSQSSIFLVLPFFKEGNQLNLEPLTFTLNHANWQEWHSLCDSMPCCLERNCTGNERQRFLEYR